MRVVTSAGVTAVFTALAPSLVNAATLRIVDGNSLSSFGIVNASIPSGPGSNLNSPNNFLEHIEDNSASFLMARSVLGDGRISLSSFFGGQVVGSAPAYRYELFGSEAAYKNTLTAASKSLTTAGDTGGSGVFSIVPLSSMVSASLAFEFSTSGNNTTVNNVFKSGVLGNNPNDSGDGLDAMSFAAVCVSSSTDENCKTVWLFLDDGGARENDDYDDMIIRITAVPLPTANWMFVAGLGALLAFRRRH